MITPHHSFDSRSNLRYFFFINNNKEMFTGIIRHSGTIVTKKKEKGLIHLTIEAPDLLRESKKKRGDSIAIDGACITVTSLTEKTFSADIMPETLRNTIMQSYHTGTKVHLENPLRAGETFDGHFVLGHVDFTGKIMEIKKDGGSIILRTWFPSGQKKYFARKGSVAVNGVSLTISTVDEESFSVSLIPQTLSSTNLSNLKIGNQVNIEIDVISRYVNAIAEANQLS